jgi:arsenite methyltransferase
MSRLSLALDSPDLAQHYENASVDRQFKAGKQLIERLQIEPGERVLDVGAGTGLLAEHVAGIVGNAGSVTGIDPLPLRIEIAKRKALANLSFAVGDAYELNGFTARRST